ncbi:hypothetical protein [Prauserella alba]|uniref:Uncharacterized protein n=1 Tax=Prauserella alba TaxID=176898 RepID=A0ABN1V7R0_9PSEU|nr:hypothetical protein [Prauserella alba]MCP2181349.1 hypothetical protein [Prauserella alba]
MEAGADAEVDVELDDVDEPEPDEPDEPDEDEEESDDEDEADDEAEESALESDVVPDSADDFAGACEPFELPLPERESLR